MIERPDKKRYSARSERQQRVHTQSGGKKMRSEFAEWLANQATLAMLLITLLVVPNVLERIFQNV